MEGGCWNLGLSPRFCERTRYPRITYHGRRDHGYLVENTFFRHSLDARVDGCVGRTAYYYVGIATLVFKMTAPRHSQVHTIAQEKEHRVGRAVSEPRAAMVKWDTGYLSSPFEFG